MEYVLTSGYANTKGTNAAPHLVFLFLANEPS